jgi:hypothetical protein
MWSCRVVVSAERLVQVESEQRRASETDSIRARRRTLLIFRSEGGQTTKGVTRLKQNSGNGPRATQGERRTSNSSTEECVRYGGIRLIVIGRRVTSSERQKKVLC